jgi:hypothetical protein
MMEFLVSRTVFQAAKVYEAALASYPSAGSFTSARSSVEAQTLLEQDRRPLFLFLLVRPFFQPKHLVIAVFPSAWRNAQLVAILPSTTSTMTTPTLPVCIFANSLHMGLAELSQIPMSAADLLSRRSTKLPLVGITFEPSS